MESINRLSAGSDAYFYIDFQGEFIYGFSPAKQALSLHFTDYHKGENHYER